MTLDATAATFKIHAHAFPLALAQPGERVRIVGVDGGHGLCKRLAEMGMGPGTDVQIEPGHHQGPRILIVKGTRLALGRGMTHRIRVIPLNPEP